MTKDERLILEIQRDSRDPLHDDSRKNPQSSSDKPRKLRFWQRPYATTVFLAFAGGAIFAAILALAGLNLLGSRGRTAHVASRNLAEYPALQSAGNPALAPASAGKPSIPQSDYAEGGEEQPVESPGLEAPQFSGPMIVGTALLNITAANYDEASKALEQLVAARGGYVEKLDSKAPSGASREIEATLRVPAKQMEALLGELRKLGRVEEESRSNTEVTAQFVDLEARLRSGRAAEQRLLQLLATRTGKLSDVLEAERELARVRAEIESMQGQRNALLNQVQYASVQVRLEEEYRETFQTRPVRTGTKIWNALIKGASNLEAGAVGLLMFLLAFGPSILFWAAIAAIPTWLIWRRNRSHRAEAPAPGPK